MSIETIFGVIVACFFFYLAIRLIKWSFDTEKKRDKGFPYSRGRDK